MEPGLPDNSMFHEQKGQTRTGSAMPLRNPSQVLGSPRAATAGDRRPLTKVLVLTGCALLLGLLVGIPVAGPPEAATGGTLIRQLEPPPAGEPDHVPAAPAPIVLSVRVSGPGPAESNISMFGSPFSLPVCSALVESGARVFYVIPAFDLESGHLLVLDGRGFGVQPDLSSATEVPLPDGSSLEVSVRPWGMGLTSMVDPEEHAALVSAWEEGSSNVTFEPIDPPAGWPPDASWEEAVVLLRAAATLGGSFDICP